MRASLRFALLTSGVFAAIACGSRTGLLVGDTQDGSPNSPDASGDVQHGETVDALPPIDVAAPADVYRNDCPDASATLVYVITEQYDLYSFYPPDLTFTNIGHINCPSTSTPFSMAVNRQGMALIEYNDGTLFTVNTANAACQATTFAPGQDNFSTFGMGYSSDTNGPAETLYIAGDTLPPNTGSNTGLASIDTTNYTINFIGNFPSSIQNAELTGTGAGDLYDLYAFYADPNNKSNSFIGQVNKSNGQLVAETSMPGVTQGLGWAFAFWGGEFWMFTSPSGGTSNITRYNPADNSIVQVTQLPEMIVGAGVSTCAPE